MAYQCNFCDSIFTRETNLFVHQKTAKYCLSLQGTKQPAIKNKCSECNKTFVHNSSLARHKKTCVGANGKVVEGLNQEINRLKNELEIAEKTIIELRLKLAEDKGQIKVYKERPTPTINTTTNYINPKLLQIKCDTIRPFTIETVREDVQAGKFTYDRFIKAEKGLLEFISDIIAKDTEFSYVCTDSSRQKFHRLLESREWKDDNGATFLNKVLDELKEPTIEYYKRITDMMVTGDRETADFLRSKTKPMVMGITCPRSADRDATFAKIRNEVKKMATI